MRWKIGSRAGAGLGAAIAVAWASACGTDEGSRAERGGAGGLATGGMPALGGATGSGGAVTTGGSSSSSGGAGAQGGGAGQTGGSSGTGGSSASGGSGGGAAADGGERSGGGGSAEGGAIAGGASGAAGVPPGGEGGSAGQAGQSSTAGHAGEAGSLPSPCDPITLECPDGGACTCYQSGPIQSSCYCSTPCEGADDCAPEEHCGGCEPTLLCLPEDAPTECCGCRCAAPDTPIATPDGERPIASLKPGDLVMSLDAGRLVAVPILATRRVPQSGHFVVEARLEDGRRLEISGGHPTADGRRFDQLAPGDRLGDARVLSVQTIPYRHPFTHDILPDSDSGTYLAAGALVGSTLAEERR